MSYKYTPKSEEWWKKAYLEGRARQKRLDKILWLAIQAYDDLSKESELEGTGRMRKLTGNFGMVAELLEKHFPKQYVKEVIKLMQRVDKIETWLTNVRHALKMAHIPVEEQQEIMQTFYDFFGGFHTCVISITRSPRTMIAADDEMPKIIPTLKEGHEQKRSGEVVVEYEEVDEEEDF